MKLSLVTIIALLCLISQVALLLKIFLKHFNWEKSSRVTFTVINIFFFKLQKILRRQKPAHVTFSSRTFLSFIDNFSKSLKISIVTLTVTSIFSPYISENLHIGSTFNLTE